MSIILCGIKNCDTVKQARRWLESQDIDYKFRDFREQPLSLDELESWVTTVGLETLVNKRSTSYRQLTDEQKNSTTTGEWLALLSETPTLIKRPVLLHPQGLHCGFKANDYEELLSEQ